MDSMTVDVVYEWLAGEREELLEQLKKKLGDDDYIRAMQLLVEAAKNQ